MTNKEAIKEFENALTIDGYRINTDAFRVAIDSLRSTMVERCPRCGSSNCYCTSCGKRITKERRYD